MRGEGVTAVCSRKVYFNFLLLPPFHLLPMLPRGQTQSEASAKRPGEQGSKEVMWPCYGECNGLPHIVWFTMTGTYSLRVLKAKSLNLRCLPDHVPSHVSGGDFLCLFQLHVFQHSSVCGCLNISSAFVFTWPPRLHLSSPLLSLIRTLDIGFRAHLHNLG